MIEEKWDLLTKDKHKLSINYILFFVRRKYRNIRNKI